MLFHLFSKSSNLSLASLFFFELEALVSIDIRSSSLRVIVVLFGLSKSIDIFWTINSLLIRSCNLLYTLTLWPTLNESTLTFNKCKSNAVSSILDDNFE